jgi:MinD-like ATPase involved in chromosome partitioning or flagellar assembly
MSTLVGVYTTRAGQTSTYWAVALAWALAERQTITLVDCDMEGGTIADLLYLRTDGRSIGNCIGEGAARPDELAGQALAVENRPRLRVIPGLQGSYGFEISDLLRRIGPALPALGSEVVIADLGHPLAHPGLRSPRASAESICSVFHRVFVVIRDEPALIARSIAVLRAAQPPHGEILFCRQRSRQLHRQVAETLARELPELPIRDATWHWDERAANRMGDSGVPISLNNSVEELGL